MDNIDKKYKLSFCSDTFNPRLTEASGTWDQLCNVILKKDLRSQKDGFGLIPSTFRPSVQMKGGAPVLNVHGREIIGIYRKREHAVETSVLALDIEEYEVGSDDPEGVQKWLQGILLGIKALVYTTFSHGVPGKGDAGFPRLRIIIPLSRPVCSQNEYKHLWAWAVETFGGAMDSGVGDASRIMYSYRGDNPDATKTRWSLRIDGHELDVDNLPGVVGISERIKAEKLEERERLAERYAREEAIKAGYLSEKNKRGKRAYAVKILENSCSRIQRAGQGDRHSTIRSQAFNVGHYVGEYLSHDEAFDALVAAGQKLYSESEKNRHKDVVRVVLDMLEAASKNPFDWSEIATPNLRRGVAEISKFMTDKIEEGHVVLGFKDRKELKKLMK